MVGVKYSGIGCKVVFSVSWLKEFYSQTRGGKQGSDQSVRGPRKLQVNRRVRGGDAQEDQEGIVVKMQMTGVSAAGDH